MVTNLHLMMHERLLLFHRKNKSLPERILVYRDGVSEVSALATFEGDTCADTFLKGQFKTVIDEELPLIKQSFRKFDKPGKTYNPTLTIIICGKRHHTRFYPTDPADADHNGNPKPGTVVDRGVTSIYHFDFFLQGMYS